MTTEKERFESDALCQEHTLEDALKDVFQNPDFSTKSADWQLEQFGILSLTLAFGARADSNGDRELAERCYNTAEQNAAVAGCEIFSELVDAVRTRSALRAKRGRGK